jgi:hypothetical protein
MKAYNKRSVFTLIFRFLFIFYYFYEDQICEQTNVFCIMTMGFPTHTFGKVVFDQKK